MIHANFSIKVFQFGHKPFPCFMIQFITSETDWQTNFRFRYKYKIIWNLRSNFIFIWVWNVNFHINCHENGVYFYFNMPIYHFEILISSHAALHGRRYFNIFNHIINTFKWIERMALFEDKQNLRFNKKIFWFIASNLPHKDVCQSSCNRISSVFFSRNDNELVSKE